MTEGVTPSLHIDYKHSDIKQYHKEGEALRTETTINDTRDFAIGRRLENLAQLRKIGFQANRRLLDVQRISHDCAIGEQALAQLERPTVVDGQRVSGLRLSDPRVQALLSVLWLDGGARSSPASTVHSGESTASRSASRTHDCRLSTANSLTTSDAYACTDSSAGSPEPTATS